MLNYKWEFVFGDPSKAQSKHKKNVDHDPIMFVIGSSYPITIFHLIHPCKSTVAIEVNNLLLRPKKKLH